MIEGQKITLGDRELTIAPANFKALRAWTKCQQETTVGSLERFDGQIEFITNVLKRNHPDIDADFVAEWVDLSNVGDIMRKMHNISGLVQKAPESGEQTAATGA